MTGSDLENSKRGGSLRPSFSNCLFVSFSFLYPLSVPFLNPLFSLSSFLLASLPSFLALLINSLSSEDKHFKFHSVSLLSQALSARGSIALPSILLHKCYTKKSIQVGMNSYTAQISPSKIIFRADFEK